MKFLLSAAVLVIMPAMAFAGLSYEPPAPEMSSDSDMVAPLILLVLVGAVIASNTFGSTMATKREADPFLLPEDDSEN